MVKRAALHIVSNNRLFSARRGGVDFPSEGKVDGKVRPSGRDTRPKGMPHPGPRRLSKDAAGMVARVLRQLLAKKRIYEAKRGRAGEV